MQIPINSVKKHTRSSWHIRHHLRLKDATCVHLRFKVSKPTYLDKLDLFKSLTVQAGDRVGKLNFSLDKQANFDFMFENFID